MNKWTIAALVTTSLALGACGGDDAGPASTTAPPDTTAADAPGGSGASEARVTLVAYDSFPTSGPIADTLAEFTAGSGIDVDVLIAGDTGTMLSKAELTAGNPEGDVIWGIDNTFLSRAVAAGVFAGEPEPVDFGDVCVNYDTAWFDEAGIAVPATLADLADPAYEDLLVVENPATSSPGLAFLLAAVAEFGDSGEPAGWEAYWEDLRDNGVLVVDSWTQAYYEEFTFAGGDRPLTVSYGSSPPYELVDDPSKAEPSTGVVDATCFRQTEYAGVLAGTDAPAAAAELLDFLTSERFQQEIPLNLYMFPALVDTPLDDVFTEWAVIPDAPLALDPDEIEANRSDWIDRWTTLMG